MTVLDERRYPWLWRVARHEAAHVIVARVLGSWATRMPVLHQTGPSHYEASSHIETPTLPGWQRARIAIYAAGAWAGGTVDGADADREAIWQVMATLPAGEERRVANGAVGFAEDLVRQHEAHIEALARDLVTDFAARGRPQREDERHAPPGHHIEHWPGEWHPPPPAAASGFTGGNQFALRPPTQKVFQPEPPVGTVLETTPGGPLIKRHRDGWTHQRQPGRLGWEAAWRTWGPPATGAPLAEILPPVRTAPPGPASPVARVVGARCRTRPAPAKRPGGREPMPQPQEPPVGSVLETRDGDEVYRIEHLPDGWAIQYRPGESEHGAAHTNGRISWRAAWRAWGPPASGSPLVLVPAGAPPLPPLPPELDADAAGGQVDMPPAAQPYRPRPRTTATPTPTRRPAASLTSGDTMTASITDVRLVIAQAVQRAQDALGPLQQASIALEEARGLFTHAMSGSEQADVSEAIALVGRAIGEITDSGAAVQAAAQSAEAVAGRL